MCSLVTIRPYEAKDKPNLEKICIATAKESDVNTEKKHENILWLYNRYYTSHEGYNCFVAADERDEAVGYIICSENFEKYSKTFKSDELRQIRKLGFHFYLFALGDLIIQKPFVKKYPAHLHIDILEEYQRMGLGHKLMDALTSNLKRKNVPGVMLIVAAKNEKGVNFYKKYGFEVVRSLGAGLVMGLRL